MFSTLLARYAMATGELQAAQELRADDALDDLLTVQETAQLLKVSVSWIYEHVRPDAEDRLPFVKLGKYLRFDRRDLHAYIEAKRSASRRQPRTRWPKCPAAVR
jgi:excisionase family DNA binding protein